MSELRQRQNVAGASSQPEQDDSTPRSQQARADEERGISVLDIIRVIVTLALATLGLSYYITNGESLLWGYRPWFTRMPVLKLYLVIKSFRQSGAQIKRESIC